jgi:hypothetical protein
VEHPPVSHHDARVGFDADEHGGEKDDGGDEVVESMRMRDAVERFRHAPVMPENDTVREQSC